MLFAVGWFVVGVPRTDDATRPDSACDADDFCDAQDEVLWSALERQLEIVAATDPFVQCRWERQLNNARGVLQVLASRNHRSSGIWSLLEWLAESSAGNYGLLHVHDDEDGRDRHSKTAEHGEPDFDNAFRVWRLARGVISEHADTLLSPIVPTVVDTP